MMTSLMIDLLGIAIPEHHQCGSCGHLAQLLGHQVEVTIVCRTVILVTRRATTYWHVARLV